jgi:hypothetical protein
MTFFLPSLLEALKVFFFHIGVVEFQDRMSFIVLGILLIWKLGFLSCLH